MAPPRLAPRAPIPVEEPVAWPLQPHVEVAPPPAPMPTRSQRETLTSLADELAARPPQAPARSHEARLAAPAPHAPAPDTAPDLNLNDVAHRLESALRRPSAQAQAHAQAEPRPAPAPRVAAPEPATEPAPPRASRSAAEPRPREAKPAAKSMYESLEQEMASLLGRPAGKT